MNGPHGGRRSCHHFRTEVGSVIVGTGVCSHRSLDGEYSAHRENRAHRRTSGTNRQFAVEVDPDQAGNLVGAGIESTLVLGLDELGDGGSAVANHLRPLASNGSVKLALEE